MGGKVEIASGVVGVASVIFLAGFVANGYGQLHTTGLYIMPSDMMDMLKVILGASVTVLYIGGAKEVRRIKQDKEVSADEQNCKDNSS